MSARGGADLGVMLAGVARGLVEAQGALDQRGRESLARWEEDAIAPVALSVMEVRVRAPINCLCSSGPTPVARRDRAKISVAPRRASAAQLTVTLRYLPWPQDESTD